MSDDAAIRKIEEEILAASKALVVYEKAKDLDRAAAAYSADAVLQAANRPQWVGRETIHQGYVDFFATVRELDGGTSKIVAGAGGDVAFEYGWNRIVFETPDGVQDVPGKFSRGWKKVDGEWLVALQTYSPDG